MRRHRQHRRLLRWGPARRARSRPNRGDSLSSQTSPADRGGGRPDAGSRVADGADGADGMFESARILIILLPARPSRLNGSRPIPGSARNPVHDNRRAAKDAGARELELPHSFHSDCRRASATGRNVKKMDRLDAIHEPGAYAIGTKIGSRPNGKFGRDRTGRIRPRQSPIGRQDVKAAGTLGATLIVSSRSPLWFCRGLSSRQPSALTRWQAQQIALRAPG